MSSYRSTTKKQDPESGCAVFERPSKGFYDAVHFAVELYAGSAVKDIADRLLHDLEKAEELERKIESISTK
jgi:hypothetical protein